MEVELGQCKEQKALYKGKWQFCHEEYKETSSLLNGLR